MKDIFLKTEDKISKKLFPDRITKSDLKKYEELCYKSAAIGGISDKKVSLNTKIKWVNLFVPELNVKEKADKLLKKNPLSMDEETAFGQVLTEYVSNVSKDCKKYTDYKNEKYLKKYNTKFQRKGTKKDLTMRNKIPDQSRKNIKYEDDLYLLREDLKRLMISDKKSSSKKYPSQKSSSSSSKSFQKMHTPRISAFEIAFPSGKFSSSKKSSSKKSSSNKSSSNKSIRSLETLS